MIETDAPAKSPVSSVTSVTGVTINGEAISAGNLSSLLSDKSLTLTNSYIAAPAVVFATNTHIEYDDASTDDVPGTVNAIVEEGTGNTFVATATVNEVDYTITVNKSVEAALEVSPASVTLTSKKIGTATAIITVTGANLTGDEVTISLPTVSGLTCDKTSLTVTEGSVSETITLSYQSTEDVAEALANVTLSDGTTSATIVVTYSSTAAVTSIESISGARSWSWKKNGVATSIDADNTTLVYFANYEGWPADFGQECLKGIGQNLYSTNGYYQGKTIVFNTTVPGQVEVVFSNTNVVSKNGVRELYLNGVPTGFVTGDKDGKAANTTAVLNVAAGEVSIEGYQIEDKDGNVLDAPTMTNLRIYSITFTPTESIAFADGDLYSYCPSFDVTIPENANVYAITSGDATSGSLTLVKQEGKLKAGEGVFLCGTEGETAVFTATTGAANISGNIIKGVTADGGEEFAANAIYILGADNKLHLNNAGTLAKGKAYIPETAVTRSAAAPAIRLSFGDETTGINGLTIEQSAIDNCIYNLSGQKVSENYKGIVIKNGKKVLVK